MKTKTKKFYSIIILTFISITSHAQTTDNIDEFRQYVNFAFGAGPNLMGYRINTNNTEYAPDHTIPSLGLDAGATLDYHITPLWSLLFNATGNIERVKLIKNDSTDCLTTYGMDLTVTAAYRKPLQKGVLILAAGPFAHFALANTIKGDGATPNPYTRIIATDPHTDEPTFAMSDFNAGITLALGYRFNNNLQITLNLKWGITDLLNYDSHDLYTKPYKITTQFSYNLD